MIRELAKASKRTVDEVLYGEVQAVLERTTALTKAGKTAAKVAMEAEASPRTWATYNGKRYAVGKVTLHSRAKGKPRSRPGAGMRFPDFIWVQLQGMMKASIAKRVAYAKGARGLGKRHWVDVGRSLGMPIKAPNYAKNAHPMPRGTTIAIRRKSIMKTAYTIGSSYSNNRWVNAPRALRSAVTGRVGFFKKNLQRGVFLNAGAVARKYGATVSR
jgi:hypothetical protein